MSEPAKRNLKTQILEQVGTFGKKNYTGQNPLENMSNIHVTVELLARAKESLEGRKTIKPKGLCKRLDMEPTRGSAILCVIILKELGWKKWNERCQHNCTWVREGAEFD